MDEQHFSHEYRTGRTQPRQNNRGLITFLLICVIFLAGLVSAMGLLNIRLFHQLNWGRGRNTPSITFSQGDSPCATDYIPSVSARGMTLSEFDGLYGQVYGLPQGLYVCAVAPGSPAEKAGILPGDVLTHANDTPITRLAQENLLTNADSFTLFRKGQTFTVCPD